MIYSIVWEVFKTNMFVQICLDCIPVYWLCKRKNVVIQYFHGLFVSGSQIPLADNIFPSKGTVVLVSFAEYR